MQKILIGILILVFNLSSVAQTKINLSLKRELDSILYKDQYFRDLISSDLLQTKADSLAATFNVPANELTEYVIKMIPITDSLNLERVEQIISQYGYPGKSIVGAGTNEAAYYVIQHSNKIDKYLSLVKSAAEKKELEFTLYAQMLDRSLMYNGKEQIYGTQGKGLQIVNKETGAKQFMYVVWPVQNTSEVNKRRKEAGFTSTIEKYAKQELGIDYKVYTLDEIKKIQSP